MIRVIVEINKCSDCRHQDSSGGFTPGGAKPVCDNPHTIEFFVKKYGDKDGFDWKYRVLHGWNCEPPEWCPLRIAGAKY